MSEWINCADEMPKNGECVDIWVQIIGGHHHGDDGRITDCFYNEKREIWWQWTVCGRDKTTVCTKDLVTHWIRQPEPPNDPN